MRIAPPGAPPLIRPRAIYWAASLALAGLLLYYALGGIDWLRVWRTMRGARAAPVLLALALTSFALWVRAMRWRVLLSAEQPVGMALTFRATAAGSLGNNVLPARAGELIRTLIISAAAGMSKAFVLTTALAERVVDATTLIAVSAAILLALPSRPGWMAPAARIFGVLGLGGVAAIALFPVFESFWFRVLAWLPLPHRFRDPLEQCLRHALRGFRSFHDAGRLSRFLLLTASIWSLDGITAVVIGQSVGIALSLPAAFLLVAALGLGSALPSTPGYVGIYQFVAVSVLAPFGISRSAAIAYILLYQALGYVVLVVWGLPGLARRKRAAADAG